MKTSPREAGSVNPLVVSNALLAVLAIALGSIMVWALINYRDQKENTDQKIAEAVTIAKKEQSEADEKNFLEREKAPYEQYVGPEDLGRVSFNYPKTWSVYTEKSTPDGMHVYLHPKEIPVVSNDQQFAAEIEVLNQGYEQVLKRHESLVKKGDLRTTQVVINGFSGTRLDGAFSSKIKGSMLVFKVRDKTLTISTDAESFRPDFDNIILKSLDFNP